MNFMSFVGSKKWKLNVQGQNFSMNLKCMFVNFLQTSANACENQMKTKNRIKMHNVMTPDTEKQRHQLSLLSTSMH